jgi:hypothetical protein
MAKTARRSGRWTLEATTAGARLTYAPSKSSETFVLDLSAAEVSSARALARKADPAGLRDALLAAERRDRALRGSATSALVAANTWRWALPLFGGPVPAGRR